jgi:hypothetical protein
MCHELIGHTVLDIYYIKLCMNNQSGKKGSG